MKNLLKISLLFILSTFVFSCGSDDTPETGGTTTEEVTSIILTSSENSATIETEDRFLFTVSGGNSNLTTSSIIYVNGTAISGSSYLPTEVGSYEVYAKYKELTSNTLTLNSVSGLTSILISTEEDVVKTNSTVNFKAKNNFNQYITEDVTFYVDGAAITGASFVADQEKSYSVYATKGDIQSETIQLISTLGYPTKLLIEDYTGAWCGYCPRLVSSLKTLEENFDNIYGVAIHNGDGMEYEYEGQLRAKFGVTGFPTGKIQRNIDWNESTGQINDIMADALSLAGVSITSAVNGSKLDIDVSVGYKGNFQDSKLVVYIIENGIIEAQANYYNDNTSSEWYGQGNPISDFVHNHVVRKAFTDVFGDNIANDQSIAGNTYSKNFSVNIPSNIADINQCSIVAFVVNAQDRVLNVNKTSVNGTVSF